MLGKEGLSDLRGFLIILILVVILLLATCYEGSVTIAFPLSCKCWCGDLLGSQLSLSHKCSHLNQLHGRGLQPRNAQIPTLPARVV